ncbi:hypothetical protein [Pedobacter sp. Leaf132]|uniref:hypothetical protein n=1 Tax=Pedobacter sp. Leaf132 TaxID=2876557 RepID=UPI001E421CE7|nr:hypothetical protein [Pedobacter sp. Leaf132]
MINSLDIYRQGTIIAKIDIDINTIFSSKLPGTELISCPIETLQVLKLQEEDYIIHRGAAYKIRILPQISKDSSKRSKSYRIDFLARFYDLHDTFIQHEGSKVFPYFQDATGHLQLLINSANLNDSGWNIGQVDATEEKLINYDWTYIRPGLDQIAQAFGLEWNAVGTKINLISTVGNNTGIVFEMGRGKGLHEITRSSDTSKEKINRVYGIGGTRNIDSTYRGGTEPNLVFEERYLETSGVTNGSERVKEGKYENLDIYPRYNGSVAEVTIVKEALIIKSVTIKDNGIDFDLMSSLQEGVKPKISFRTGSLTGIDFEISDFSLANKSVTLIPFTDTSGYYFPSDTSKPEVGDKYTFIDVRMPESYKIAAEVELKQETQKFLNENKGSRQIFAVKPDEKFLRDNNIKLNCGDRATAIDGDLGLDEVLRFIEISYPIVNEFDVTGVIGNEIIFDTAAKQYAAVLNNTKQIAEITARGIIQYKRAAQALRQLESSVFDTDGNFDIDKFNVGVLTAALGIFGVKSQNFVLSAVRLTDNVGGDANAVNISGGQLIHLEISNTGTNGDTWTITSFSQSGLNPSSLYYIYVKCSKTSQVGSWVVTTDKIKPEDVAGFYHFLAGRIYPVNNGFRDSEFTYGITDITGNRIKTGTIAGRNNALEINLETGTIKGDVTFVGNSLSAINNISNNASSALSNAATAQGVANTAITNASGALTAANNAQNSANLANQVIANIANDNILAASEKSDVLKEYNIIVGERPIIIAQAGQYSVNATNYDNNYAALINYLNPLLSAMGSDDVINGVTFRQYFTNYYNEKVSLLSAIAIKAKQLADAAQSAANTAINNAAIVQNNLTNIQNALGGLAYQSAVELAQLGSTIIQGGYIKTSLIETNALIISGGLATQSYAVNQASSYSSTAQSNAQNFASNAINGIKIGGANLLANSDKIYTNPNAVGLGAVTYQPAGIPRPYFSVVSDSDKQVSQYAGIGSINFDLNTDYTISVWVNSPQAANIQLYVSGPNMNFVETGNLSLEAFQWRQISCKFSTSSNNVSYLILVSDKTTLNYRDFKIEKGNNATDWTPSNLDVDLNAQIKADLAKDAAAIDATTKALAAQNTAINQALTYANNAQTTASLNGQNYANAALSAAQIYAQNQATQAKADAISNAASDAFARSYAAGKMLNRDPEFANGFNGLTVYNNLENGKVSFGAGENGAADFGAAIPNGSNKYMAVSYAGGGASPGLGGFTFSTAARANAIFIIRLMAYIPVGFNINWTTNPGTSIIYQTDNTGIGAWKEYLFTVKCNTSGSFGATNYFFITGPDVSMAFWLASATVYDMTAKEIDAIAYADTKATATINAAQSYADSIATSKANVAQLSAISAASSDATAKANSARSDAVGYSQSLVNSIQLGGVNLILNSKNAYPTGGYLFFQSTLTEPFITGQQYTISGRYDSFYGSFGAWISSGSIHLGFFTYLGNGYYSLTFTAPETNGNLVISVYNIANQSGSIETASHYWTKLERGSKRTDWSPAIQDVDAVIANAQTAANNAINAYNNLTTSLKGMAYQDVVEYSKLGSTIIQGGYIRSNLIDADYIKANVINAGYIQGLDIVGKSIRTPGTDKFFEVSAALNNFRLYSGGNVLLEGDDDSAVESITIQANDFPLPPTIIITYGPGFRVGDFSTSDGASSIGRKGFITNGFYKKINQVSGATEFEVTPDGVVKANTGLSVTGNTVLDTIKVKDGNTELTGWTGYVFQVAGGSSNQVRINQTPSIPPGATWAKTTYKNGIVVNVDGGQN